MWFSRPFSSTHSAKPPMKSALATMHALGAAVGHVRRSASMAYERPWMRGIMPRWTFCTSPANVNRVCVGSGGRMP